MEDKDIYKGLSDRLVGCEKPQDVLHVYAWVVEVAVSVEERATIQFRVGRRMAELEGGEDFAMRFFEMENGSRNAVVMDKALPVISRNLSGRG